VRLDDLVLLLRELPGLEEDGVRDRDLAEVVQRRRLAHQPDRPVVQAEVAAELRGEVPDALGVLLGVVVAVLGREREPAQRVHLIELELAPAGERQAGDHRLELAQPLAQALAVHVRAQPAQRRAGERLAGAGDLLGAEHERAAAEAERVQARADRARLAVEHEHRGRRFRRDGGRHLFGVAADGSRLRARASQLGAMRLALGAVRSCE
jgi:hypothetical protein